MADDEAAESLQEKSGNNPEEMEEEDEDEEFFEVEQIMAKSKVKGVVTYKVRWKGYGSEEDTWEPIDNLDSCKELIEEFDKKREEGIKQKAEERKMRQAIMEGRISSPGTSEEDSPYPPNFKNSFWKDLEAGRIDVFDSNMYSKVKERSVKQQSLKEFQESKEQKVVPDKKPSEDAKKLRVNKSCESSPINRNKPSVTVSLKGKSTTSSASENKPTCSSKSKNTHKSNDFYIQSDSESDSDYTCTPVLTEIKKENISASDTEKAVVQRPGIKLIMKLPKPPGDSTCERKSTDKHETSESSKRKKKKHSRHRHSEVQRSHTECHSSTESKSKHTNHKDKPKHSVLKPEHTDLTHKHSKLNHTVRIPRETELNPKHRESNPKLKEHGHKERGSVQTSVKNLSSQSENHRKRKISETLDLDHSSCVVVGSLKDKKGMMESADTTHSEDVVDKKGCDSVGKQETVTRFDPKAVETDKFDTQFRNCSLNSTPIITPKEETTNEVGLLKDVSLHTNQTEDYDDLNWNLSFIDDSEHNEHSVSQHTVGFSAIKTEPSFDLNHHHGSHHVTHNYNTISHNFITPSHNYTTSHNHGDLMQCTNTNPNDTFESFPLPHLDCNLNTSAGTCITRRDSETVDSGIASPASEKSLGLSRNELFNPLDDVLDQSILPFFPDSENVPEREADHDFNIDLDEIDWELFDREVKLEPLSLSNGEFVKAVMTGDYGLVKRGFMGEGKYDLEHADPSGKTLLTHAAQHGYDDIADLLIEHGANVNTQMPNGFTPLMTACQFAELCTVNLLIELGAKVNMQTYNGESALMIAVRRGHKHITWLLLESGANFSLNSHAGYTALNYARAFNHVDTETVISTHAQRLMTEFNRQVSFTLNNLANLREMVFPPQVFNTSEEEIFHVNFNYTSQLPPIHGLGYLLFLGHAVFTNEEVKCRFYGPCAVKAACLNGVALSPLTQEGNFVLAFNPVVPGNNILTVNAVKETEMKGKLIVCAYKAQLV